MPQVEVCFSPLLYPHRSLRKDIVTVVIDVLRATTAFCAAFDAGAESILPVDSLEELKVLKAKGYLTAAERDGKKVDFADFGNSPTNFLKLNLERSRLAYSTTNGTRALGLAIAEGEVAVACFANLQAVALWLIGNQKDVVLLCSGWKNTFSLEDSVCAGALAQILCSSGKYSHLSDASVTSLQLWNDSHSNLQKYCSQASHYQRLLNQGLEDDLNLCFLIDTSFVVPFWDGEKLVKI
ncbi:MAG: 2-phosphosulfolactate phosphatase [Bacteroidetes bacterium]|nr:2-phosphosulfolactate phosphatase [Bacteroidota bacterium]